MYLVLTPWPLSAGESFYQEPDFSDRRALLDALDALRRGIDFDVSHHRTHRYSENFSAFEARQRVSAETLRSIMTSSPRKNTAVEDQNVIALRRLELGEVLPRVETLFQELVGEQEYGRLAANTQLWYPENGYMGWHTNNAARGCRLYCSHAPQEGRSFFRYRDPASGAIRTSEDGKGWTFRLFRICSKPLWHCVHSTTDRISLGFTLTPPRPEYGPPASTKKP